MSVVRLLDEAVVKSGRAPLWVLQWVDDGHEYVGVCKRGAGEDQHGACEVDARPYWALQHQLADTVRYGEWWVPAFRTPAQASAWFAASGLRMDKMAQAPQPAPLADVDPSGTIQPRLIEITEATRQGGSSAGLRVLVYDDPTDGDQPVIASMDHSSTISWNPAVLFNWADERPLVFSSERQANEWRAAQAAHLNARASWMLAMRYERSRVVTPAEAGVVHVMPGYNPVEKCEVIAEATRRRGQGQRWVLGSPAEEYTRAARVAAATRFNSRAVVMWKTLEPGDRYRLLRDERLLLFTTAEAAAAWRDAYAARLVAAGFEGIGGVAALAQVLNSADIGVRIPASWIANAEVDPEPCGPRRIDTIDEATRQGGHAGSWAVKWTMDGEDGIAVCHPGATLPYPYWCMCERVGSLSSSWYIPTFGTAAEAVAWFSRSRRSTQLTHNTIATAVAIPVEEADPNSVMPHVKTQLDEATRQRGHVGSWAVKWTVDDEDGIAICKRGEMLPYWCAVSRLSSINSSWWMPTFSTPAAAVAWFKSGDTLSDVYGAQGTIAAIPAEEADPDNEMPRTKTRLGEAVVKLTRAI